MTLEVSRREKGLPIEAVKRCRQMRRAVGVRAITARHAYRPKFIPSGAKTCSFGRHQGTFGSLALPVGLPGAHPAYALLAGSALDLFRYALTISMPVGIIETTIIARITTEKLCWT
jgi:hypothetical protein